MLLGRVCLQTRCRRNKTIAVLKKVRYALCPMPYALCPMPYALCSMPYALCPMPYASTIDPQFQRPASCYTEILPLCAIGAIDPSEKNQNYVACDTFFWLMIV